MRTAASTTLDDIPEPIRAFVARRGSEAVGLGLTGAAAETTFALASWPLADPSFNHAAFDLIMHLPWLPSIVFLAPPILWGWRLPATRRLERSTSRLMLWLGRCSVCSGCVSV
jgi:S-DNA-T family DNA segregation ATPase FtsK/SpoIIIE